MKGRPRAVADECCKLVRPFMAPLAVHSNIAGDRFLTGTFPPPLGHSWIRRRPLQRRDKSGAESQTTSSEVCKVVLTREGFKPWPRDQGSTENVTFDPGGGGIGREKEKNQDAPHLCLIAPPVSRAEDLEKQWQVVPEGAPNRVSTGPRVIV